MMIKPAVVQISGGHMGGDAHQANGLFSSGQQLRRTLIGKTIHSYAAVASRMLAQPRYRLRTVPPFVPKRVEHAERTAAAAQVLNGYMVFVTFKPHWMRVNDCRSNIATIRLPHEQFGPRSVVY